MTSAKQSGLGCRIGIGGARATAMALAAGLVGSAQATPPQYYITDLGVLPGGDNWSAGYRLNDYGQVVGATGHFDQNNQLESQPFLWTPIAPNNIAGSMVGLGNFGGTMWSGATDINKMGQVSGYAQDANGNSQAFLWTPSGGNNTSVGSKVQVGIVGLTGAWETGINDQGQVAGEETSGQRPALWTPNSPNGNTGSVQYPPYQGYGSARDLNNNGDMTGHMNGYNGTYQAVRYSDPGGGYVYTNIGDDGGPSYYNSGSGSAINDSGLVVGSYQRPDGSQWGFMWDTQGNITDIMPNFADFTRAFGVDESGDVVGDVFFGNRLHAFLYTGGMSFDQAQFYDLEDYIDPNLGWSLQGATGMNAFGQICGYGVINGQIHGYLLTPVPAPGVAAVIGVGGLVAARRRRNC